MGRPLLQAEACGGRIRMLSSFTPSSCVSLAEAHLHRGTVDVDSPPEACAAVVVAAAAMTVQLRTPRTAIKPSLAMEVRFRFMVKLRVADRQSNFLAFSFTVRRGRSDSNFQGSQARANTLSPANNNQQGVFPCRNQTREDPGPMVVVR